MLSKILLGLLVFCATSLAVSIDDCNGYEASNIKHSSNGMTADLKLSGTACNVYGKDLDNLVLDVQYQTASRLHIKIYDAAEQVYQVPSSVLSPPTISALDNAEHSALEFQLTAKPFSFAVVKVTSQETIFNTSGSSLIFESQYLRLRTSLPTGPNLYGLGESSDSFRLNTTNYTRTLWSRDAYGIPAGTNLYGNHPIYFEHREATNETHGIFLFNSNGMDIKINNTAESGQYLEYNTLGGVIDLYVLAGPDPLDVAEQYTEVVGKPAMMPYWGFGFHQCRYGYEDVIQVAEVVYNYSLAGIPLETMWTDIDYMDMRKVFTLDPERFPLEKMRELVDYLHANDQHYIVMVDPAVAYQNYDGFNNGAKLGIFLKNADGSIYQGVVWPGVTVFPDWFNEDTQIYWNSEFDSFFNADTGLDIDALWIDMNEASNFCTWPCTNATQFAIDNGFPPAPPELRTMWEPLPGFPADFQPPTTKVSKRETQGSMKGLPGRNFTDPPYSIDNEAAGSLSNHTIFTDLVHANGLVEYDTHNLYGTMMSAASRNAMLTRRPALRPMIITRSTFAGAGAKVGHWLGDNFSTWEKYQISIAEMIAFAAIYQVPMVGSDVCGYAQNTTETLCARWAMLGAFYPFYRNHNANDAISQEFYRWPMVAEAARVAIKARYQLLDYIYTAMHQQTVNGAPVLNPMWFLYPEDSNALPIDQQYFFGSSLLVSPVMNENVTDVTAYFPKDQFYDFFTLAPLSGEGSTIHITDVPYTAIPVHIRGGSILPLRVDGANTTTALRKLDFELVVAPSQDGLASGSLYIDDGVLLEQPKTTEIEFSYSSQCLEMTGKYEYDAGVKVATAVFLNVDAMPRSITLNGNTVDVSGCSLNQTSKALTVPVGFPLSANFKLVLG